MKIWKALTRGITHLRLKLDRKTLEASYFHLKLIRLTPKHFRYFTPSKNSRKMWSPTQGSEVENSPWTLCVRNQQLLGRPLLAVLYPATVETVFAVRGRANTPLLIIDTEAEINSFFSTAPIIPESKERITTAKVDPSKNIILTRLITSTRHKKGW